MTLFSGEAHGRNLVQVGLLFLCSAFALGGDDTLYIYWIDVEGGAATLIVTPGGEIVLTDAGWDGFDDRDAARIEYVLKHEIKASRIDYFIASHFHGDHVGGLPALAQRVPIETFVDHGDSVDQEKNERLHKIWQNYLSVAKGRRKQVKPGDLLPLESVELIFVTSAGRVREDSAGNRRNPFCEGAANKPPDQGENGQSVGFILRWGQFDFLNLGDLMWSNEHELVCPNNRLGQIDLYQITHHGSSSSNAPQLVLAIQPMVAVMNNGPHKGGSPTVLETLRAISGFRDLWQGHYAMDATAEGNTEQVLIANLHETEACEGHWIRATIRPDGTFTVTNSRNGYSKNYRAK